MPKRLACRLLAVVLLAVAAPLLILSPAKAEGHGGGGHGGGYHGGGFRGHGGYGGRGFIGGGIGFSPWWGYGYPYGYGYGWYDGIYPYAYPAGYPYPPSPALAPPPDAAAVPTYDQSTCREFQSTIAVDGVNQPAHGVACLQPDGTWRIVR